MELKGMSFVAVAVAAAAAGYAFAASLYKADLAELERRYADAAQEAAQKNLKESEENVKKLSEALAERDDALDALRASRSESDRLRERAESLADRLSAAGAGACHRERESLASCIRLLGEGVDLAGEGAELFGRSAADIEVMRRALGR